MSRSSWCRPRSWFPTHFRRSGGLRAFRILRLIHLVRAFAVATIGLRSARDVLRSHGFPYVLLVTGAAIGLGAIGITRSSGGSPSIRPQVHWWATVAVTTVGYGDVNPVTGEGPAIALVLMLVGVGVIGILEGQRCQVLRWG